MSLLFTKRDNPARFNKVLFEWFDRVTPGEDAADVEFFYETALIYMNFPYLKRLMQREFQNSFLNSNLLQKGVAQHQKPIGVR